MSLKWESTRYRAYNEECAWIHRIDGSPCSVRLSLLHDGTFHCMFPGDRRNDYYHPELSGDAAHLGELLESAESIVKEYSDHAFDRKVAINKALTVAMGHGLPDRLKE